jgi:hypothetical protein
MSELRLLKSLFDPGVPSALNRPCLMLQPEKVKLVKINARPHNSLSS